MSKNVSLQFNAEQQVAVEHGEGPLLIIAGPGTGKTKTLTARIAYLLQEKRVPAQAILALTFTNKAAHEMRERVSAILGPDAKLPLICTFHALANHLLPNEKQLVDEATRLTIIRNIKKSQATDLSARDIGLAISRAKNTPSPPTDPALATLVQMYNLELDSQGLRDFDDLLLGLHDTLRRTSLAKESGYHYILVDEFQDTNALQYDILKLLDTTKNVFVIGDPLQSIYGFRGAHAAIFDQFKRDWPDTKEITLATNYRSVTSVVRMANALFPDAPELQAYRQDTGRTEAVEVLNEYGEADWIVHEIERQIGGSDMLQSSVHHASGAGQGFRNFAVLYRTHAIARTLQQALEKSGIPYQVAGEGSPYLTAGVQAIIQSLEYLAGRTDAPEAKGFTVTQLRVLLDSRKPKLTNITLTNVVMVIIETLGLSYEKHESLRQFANSLLPYDKMPLNEYLDHLQSLAEQAYYDPSAEAVTLLTIHAAKGLEFSRVFLIGVEEGILPHARDGKIADLAEEKRLLYVAVTRARDELVMLHTRTRQKSQSTVSSFIADLPQDLLMRTIDPDLDNQQQKARRSALKRAQGKLF